MKNDLSSIDAVDMNFDNVGAFSLSQEYHIEFFLTVLWCLNDNGFTINPTKMQMSLCMA
jgi:hypothetical protein